MIIILSHTFTVPYKIPRHIHRLIRRTALTVMIPIKIRFRIHKFLRRSLIRRIIHCFIQVLNIIPRYTVFKYRRLFHIPLKSSRLLMHIINIMLHIKISRMLHIIINHGMCNRILPINTVEEVIANGKLRMSLRPVSKVLT